MYQLQYVSKRTGEVRVYDLDPQAYRPTAAESCLQAIRRAGKLTREGTRWRAGPQGRRYQNTTVQQLVRAGRLLVDGNSVRIA